MPHCKTSRSLTQAVCPRSTETQKDHKSAFGGERYTDLESLEKACQIQSGEDLLHTVGDHGIPQRGFLGS